jgi:hypothetical protein
VDGEREVDAGGWYLAMLLRKFPEFIEMSCALDGFGVAKMAFEILK